MKDVEIARFNYEDLIYILYSNYWDLGKYKVARPYFLVSKKSSLKNRKEKLFQKQDIHFKRIEIKNPIVLYKKIFNVYKEFLKDFDIVIVQAYEDSIEKREKIYFKALKEMGFEKKYFFEWSSLNEHVFIKKELKLKRKEISRIYESLFGKYMTYEE